MFKETKPLTLKEYRPTSRLSPAWTIQDEIKRRVDIESEGDAYTSLDSLPTFIAPKSKLKGVSLRAFLSQIFPC